MKSVRLVCVLQWIGRLGPLLHAFDTDASDLLTADPATLHLNNRSGYHAHGLRNYLRDDQVWKALLAPAPTWRPGRPPAMSTTASNKHPRRIDQPHHQLQPAPIDCKQQTPPPLTDSD